MARILIVDDQPEILELLRTILERAGHDVHDAPDGDRALRWFRLNPCDLVITDMFMPDKDGVELILELRETSPETRVIAMSGGGRLFSREEILRNAALLGVSGFLRKPFTIQEVHQTVQETLSGWRNGG